MNNSFTKWLKLFLAAFFVLALLQAVGVILTVRYAEMAPFARAQIINIEIIFILIFFSLLSSVFVYIPIVFRRSLKRFFDFCDEINRGRLDYEIRGEVGRELTLLADALNGALQSFRDYDYLKKSKIIEQYNRIHAVLDIIEDGILILDEERNVLHINNALRIFWDLKSDFTGKPLEELSLRPEIFRYIDHTLKSKIRSEIKKIYIKELGRHIQLSNAMVRNEKGEVINYVIAFRNIKKSK